MRAVVGSGRPASRLISVSVLGPRRATMRRSFTALSITWIVIPRERVKRRTPVFDQIIACSAMTTRSEVQRAVPARTSLWSHCERRAKVSVRPLT